MPLAQDISNAIDNDQSQAVPSAAAIPYASPTQLLPSNLSPSRGPVSQELMSRDGADSGK